MPDSNARARVAARIDRLGLGNPGDVKPVGGGVSEMRIDYGPGYRVYYARSGRVMYLLLCGGDQGYSGRRYQGCDCYECRKSPGSLGCSAAKGEEMEVIYGCSNSEDREVRPLRLC
ncbi:MAG: type II toxin-antitoxin system RelE/ParE family toxin [Steroidobacteraceae bacterium]